MKTVEGLLEKGLIEVANKEEELKVTVFFGLIKGQQTVTFIFFKNMLPHMQICI